MTRKHGRVLVALRSNGLEHYGIYTRPGSPSTPLKTRHGNVLQTPLDFIKQCGELPVVAEADVGIGTWLDMVSRCIALTRNGFSVHDVLNCLRNSVVGRAGESELVRRHTEISERRQSALKRREASRDHAATTKALAEAKDDIEKLHDQKMEHREKCRVASEGREGKLRKANATILAAAEQMAGFKMGTAKMLKAHKSLQAALKQRNALTRAGKKDEAANNRWLLDWEAKLAGAKKRLAEWKVAMEQSIHRMSELASDEVVTPTALEAQKNKLKSAADACANINELAALALGFGPGPERFHFVSSSRRQELVSLG